MRDEKFQRPRCGGSGDRAAMSGVGMGVTLVGGLAGAAILSDTGYPRPGATPDQIREFFRENRGAARVAVAGQALSTIMLGRFSASVAGLAGRSGSRAASIGAVAGGCLAAAALGYSAANSAVLTTAAGDDPQRAVDLHRRAFDAGGPGHAVGFGLLMASLGVAARRGGELPRPLGSAAIASAAANLLAPLYYVAKPAAPLIPAGRFSGLIVSAVAAGRLARGGGRSSR